MADSCRDELDKDGGDCLLHVDDVRDVDSKSRRAGGILGIDGVDNDGNEDDEP